MPPAVRARIIMIPANHLVIVPIEIAAQPGANDKTDVESNEGSAVGLLVINLGGLIVGDIEIASAGRENLDITIVVNDLDLRSGLEIAQVISLEAQALDGIHDALLLAGKGLAELRGPIEVIIHPF